MSEFHLSCSPETTHWGFFESRLAPVLSVPDGAIVTIDTVTGARDQLPPPGFHVPPELHAIHEAQPGPPFGPHILTGPIHVEGARPGDVLMVEVLDVRLRQDWGFNFSRPLAGALPEDFPEYHLMHIALDSERNVGRLPWGLELPLAPFFGVMGVAPPPAWGRCTSIIPRAFGGNIDNRELVAGATLFLPVFVEGALFSCGDGHALQGDGEVNLTAIETALSGRFRFTIRRDMTLAGPRIETPTHLVTCAFDPDLDRCAERALREMIALVAERTGLEAAEVYALCSIAADLRITQLVNQHKGVHCMLRKTLIA